MAKGTPPPRKPVRTTPVRAYATFAEHYAERVKRIARHAVAAMTSGDLERAAVLYEQGVFAQQNYDHYRRIAACIGKFPTTQLTLPKPKEL